MPLRNQRFLRFMNARVLTSIYEIKSSFMKGLIRSHFQKYTEYNSNVGNWKYSGNSSSLNNHLFKSQCRANKNQRIVVKGYSIHDSYILRQEHTKEVIQAFTYCSKLQDIEFKEELVHYNKTIFDQQMTWDMVNSISIQRTQLNQVIGNAHGYLSKVNELNIRAEIFFDKCKSINKVKIIREPQTV